MPPAGRSAGHRVRRFRIAAIAALGLTLVATRGDAVGFDFYVLSLSWSPSYCAAEGGRADPLECRQPLGFVTHGLWPQYERGYPQYCASNARPPSTSAIAVLGDIMPSRGLIRHEWAKHGVCTGLSGNAYLALIRQAREKIVIPDAYVHPNTTTGVSPRAVEAAFASANPGLSLRGIAISCDGTRLREVRICLTRDLKFRSCFEVDNNGCRRSTVTMPAVGMR
jgi:ribonuclease T2